MFLRVNLNDSLITLLNIYAPAPNSDWSFFSQIFELIIAESQGVLIWGGDLNIRLCPKLDSSKIQVAQPSHLNKRINSAIKDIGLVDVWRELNPLKRDYTYFSNPHLLYSRFDYFLIFGKDLHRVGDCSIGIMDLSDHSPLYLKLKKWLFCRGCCMSSTRYT